MTALQLHIDLGKGVFKAISIRHYEVIGYSIEDIVKGPIGKVTGVADLKLNPLLIIDFNGKEILLPLFDGLIVNVDRESKQLKVNAPEGLIDLYLD